MPAAMEMLLHAFADGLRHLIGLAQAIANTPLAIADHHDRAEAETPTALNYLGNPIDVNDLFNQIFLHIVLCSPRLGQVTPPLCKA